MNRISFHPEAENELLREVAYCSQARAGTGSRFLAAVEAALARAVRHPFGGAPSFTETRSILIKGFPFSLVYRCTSGELFAVAIAPHRKRPLYWADRNE